MNKRQGNNYFVNIIESILYIYDSLSLPFVYYSSGQHAAILNSGAEIFVPTFIGAGMKIRVNVYDGLYVERA
jgi:hypothetical protein